MLYRSLNNLVAGTQGTQECHNVFIWILTGNGRAGCENLATLYTELKLKSIQTQFLEVVDTDLLISNKFEKSTGSWVLGLKYLCNSCTRISHVASVR